MGKTNKKNKIKVVDKYVVAPEGMEFVVKGPVYPELQLTKKSAWKKILENGPRTSPSWPWHTRRKTNG